MRSRTFCTKSIGPCWKALEKCSANDARLIPARSARLPTLCGAAGWSRIARTARANRGWWRAVNKGESMPSCRRCCRSKVMRHCFIKTSVIACVPKDGRVTSASMRSYTEDMLGSAEKSWINGSRNSSNSPSALLWEAEIIPHSIKTFRVPSPAVNETKPSPSMEQCSSARRSWMFGPDPPSVCGWRAGTISAVRAANGRTGPVPTRQVPCPARTKWIVIASKAE